jgi:hypothetical protein
MLFSCHQKECQNCDIEIALRLFENMPQIKNMWEHNNKSEFDLGGN